jgi:NAD(P)-dependent dehydrogenase (short-subunit alcohol dehydrogenase family)
LSRHTSSKTLRPDAKLRGRVALITGATRGIGLAVARLLSAQGCSLVITGRDHAALARAGKELAHGNVRVVAQVCDVRDAESVRALFWAVGRQFKRIDILFNNAGMAHANLPVERLPFSTWKEVVDTNLNSLFLVTQAALALMQPRGTIVNNLSIAANRAFPGSAAYNASKHGALGFTNTLREELRRKNIRVIGLLPGATNTHIWKTLGPKAPRRKMMSPQTVAQAVVNAILLPANATVENLEILPTSGKL